MIMKLDGRRLRIVFACEKCGREYRTRFVGRPGPLARELIRAIEMHGRRCPTARRLALTKAVR